MKGDIAFAGFMLTAEEWQELDPDMRAQLIAVATRRVDPWLAAPSGPLAEGSGPMETEEFLDLDPSESGPVTIGELRCGDAAPNWASPGDIDFGPVLDPKLETHLRTKLR